MLRIILLMTLVSLYSFGQDSLQLDLSEIKVSANINRSEIIKTARNVSVISAEEIAKSPTKTIDGILQYALNVDVRSRSPFGVQADVSIRGGHFDQTLIMIDGVKMNDPQTGHHTLNLPVPVELIDRIEVLQGGASRVYGPNAFSGLINIITKSSAKGLSSIGLAGGENGLYKLDGNFAIQGSKSNSFVSLSKIHSDGYSHNTAFDRTSIYAKTSIEGKKGFLTVQGGIMDNNFGASNFYHPKFYDQYEETGSRFLALSKTYNFSNKLSGTLIASLRNHKDLYDFNNYIDSPQTYNNVNFHKSNVIDIEWKMRYLSDFGASSIGAEWRQEGIISNRLGDEVEEPKEVKDFSGIFYDKSKTRQNFSVYLEQQKTFGKLTFSGGALLNINSQFGTELYPGLDVSYAVSNGFSVYGTVNKSLRFPTFTEMYLNTSTVKADPNLLPEKAINYELGLKKFSSWTNFTASVFYKQTTDAIDKVKRPNLEVPTMENIDNINMAGLELVGQFDLAKKLNNANLWFQKVQFNYAYLVADRKEIDFQSFYTLNFLKHKAGMGTFFRLGSNISASAFYTFKMREGDFRWDAESPLQNYKPVHLVDVRVDYTRDRFKVFIDANNLLNYEYFEFGFVEQPRRWLSGGVKLTF